MHDVSSSVPSAAETQQVVIHPLEPLTAGEISNAAAIVCEQATLGPRARFISITLHEPSKEQVLAFPPDGEVIDREAEIILLDPSQPGAFEALVSLSQGKLLSWEYVQGVQPAVTFEEILEVENLVKQDPQFQTVLARRGITDMRLVMVEPWPAGYYGAEDDPAGRRLSRPIVFVRDSPHDNGHAHPVEGVVVLVDLGTMQVVRVEDYGVVPVPPAPGNYTPEAVGQLRTDLKPLEITQPDGPSFQVNGHQVTWQKWHLRIGWTAREGLVLYTLGYEDQGRVRPILYRASMAEMIVSYGDPAPTHYRKNVLDEGEHGLGMLANSLRLGCDCLGYIHYFDAVMSNGRGEAVTLPNAVCMHEEDYGVLWKHTDWRTNEVETRRSRRLVLSFFATVGHYDYGFFWYLYQDGTIQYEVKLTGVMNSGAVLEGVVPKHGTLVAPGVNAIIHQHFFNVRLDWMVDGLKNSVYEVQTTADPIGPDNPHGNAFYAVRNLLATEQQAQRVIDPLHGRYWVVGNPEVHNEFGQMVGYKLVPGDNVLPFAHPEAWVSRRAGFIHRHLWVTPYAPRERYPAGKYPNQHPGGDGLPAWTAANRSIENTNLVVWYTMGTHHVPRPEDWPVMPVSYIGFHLKPVGFFDRSPALDVPPSHNSETCSH